MQDSSHYNGCLAMTFTEFRTSVDKVTSINSVRKVITLEGSDVNGYQPDSDVVIQYDVLSEAPLLLVERVKLVSGYTIIGAKNFCDGISIPGYVVHVEKNTKGFADITIVKSNIYEELTGGNKK